MRAGLWRGRRGRVGHRPDAGDGQPADANVGRDQCRGSGRRQIRRCPCGPRRGRERVVQRDRRDEHHGKGTGRHAGRTGVAEKRVGRRGTQQFDRHLFRAQRSRPGHTPYTPNAVHAFPVSARERSHRISRSRHRSCH